jgi:Ser/Thr protein kinase RdoA (MazF antagonist)
MTKQFENMTKEEQKAWWLKLAYSTLEQHFGIHDAEVNWLAYTHNAVFDVKLEDYHWVLRLYGSNTMDYERLVALAKWLKDLQTATNISVSSVEWYKDKPQIAKLPVNGKLIPAALYKYVGGQTLEANTVNANEMKLIGEFLAKMHSYSGKSLSDFSFPQLDYNGLFGETGIYYPGEEAMQVFTDGQLTVMDAAAEKVKAAMDELGTGESEFGLIHGDLLLQNILFHEGEVRALDFEYCGWGYYLYDLTPILWQLKPQAHYPELEQALWDGYSSIRPLSSRHRELLETFIAGRQVASMRWVAANRHNPSYQGKVEVIMVLRAAELQGFLETGILKRK